VSRYPSQNQPQWGSNAYAIPAAEAPAADRATFIKKTYLHLIGALLALTGIEFIIFAVVPQETLAGLVGWATSGWMWLLVLGAFMGVSILAGNLANSGQSEGVQYAGLGLYVVAQSLILVPLLFIAANFFPDTNIIGTAVLVTLLMVGALTAFVFITGADFSFLRGFLMVAGFAAIGLIVASILFGFSLGIIFVVAMLIVLCGFVLYETSNVLHHYPVGSHVAASLALFASVATMFWYVLQLLMHLQDD
jgi:FtsH-binding integral membrane protein